ncbi:hypothetical protein MD484_g7455, partial [Candolleomyces efflorescens]
MAEETKRFLRNVKSDPTYIFPGLTTLFGSTIMRATYGFDDTTHHAELVHDTQKLLDEFFEAIIPGQYLVDYVPLLRHVPSWLPGAGFKKKFRDVAELSVKENGRNGKHPSMAHSLIERLPDLVEKEGKEMEDVALNMCATAYLAGKDTTINSATALLYALSHYPDVQARAQAEVDEVVGSDRLPCVSDRERLPAILHDSTVFDRPFDFIPERYIIKGGTAIDPSVPDPDIAAFGHGRRICPGQHFSNDALFLLAASLLATYTLTAPKDKDGKVILMEIEQRNFFISKPKPFECEICPRLGREHLLDSE